MSEASNFRDEAVSIAVSNLHGRLPAEVDELLAAVSAPWDRYAFAGWVGALADRVLDGEITGADVDDAMLVSGVARVFDPPAWRAAIDWLRSHPADSSDPEN